MTFYLYKSTEEGVFEVAQFDNEDSATECMEHLAQNNIDPTVFGYAVRDYKLKTIVEYEV